MKTVWVLVNNYNLREEFRGSLYDCLYFMQDKDIYNYFFELRKIYENGRFEILATIDNDGEIRELIKWEQSRWAVK